ncbi:phosphatidylcholine:ceramide cholinephosphotransferase 1 isoform X1 [Psammomys obesus]|uniref:phosphatidylcholine:ceramide cholinephosphotransferase 1 isoform X1 n=1 Tax=Psammomys obesus TaxID=48139 RepID=UPI002452B226|nr:phosphatidylcholine:ceramide cholinephosphotransferase 1 isoform X1 [Psammomys obesus]XP_055469816.1 phosphatidylcholine:ceramide cholinephosphotransferase 1 isoform X1 [Psammomys obesus]XP_055469817.1 phosphatidylcholine:ceramide cholinephosphotransferase 1 isoform X1 [Psammomys obesus]XP_055469818.1 phosphatidylcholine:ceramide cholinephosphotransferase 1 isoform X1 [Psammomys obesus]XP_055469821.1 phosphatidylcholine:ceramide cholinephosphotransferase 1 isoform X1 [Psammomys obesus]
MLAVSDIHKLLVLLALLSTCNTCLGSSPHQPKLLTWEVTNQRHIIIWSVSKIAPPFTWWPDLYPDLCKMALGAPANWDLQSHLDPNVVPGDSRRGSFSERRGLDPWGGCGTTNHRSMLRVLTFYVCPGPHQQPKLVNKCGGRNDFYCKNWGCETTGDTYWKPTSSWDYIIVKANYSHAEPPDRGPNNRWTNQPICTTWCHPLLIQFTDSGKRISTNWLTGFTWGLRIYKERYDDGLLFTIKLKITTPSAEVEPNKAGPRLVPPVKSDPQTMAPRPVTPSPNSKIGKDSSPKLPGPYITSLAQGAFQALNNTNPKVTESCWLCFGIAPPYYEGIAFTDEISNTQEATACRWTQREARLSLSAVSGQGLCVGKIPPSHQFLCNQTYNVTGLSGYLIPPTNGWWACATGITTCVSTQVLVNSSDYCVLVQVIPRVTYHPYEEPFQYWDSVGEPLIRTKRDLGISLAIMLGIGLGTAGTAAGGSAIALRHSGLNELRAAVDEDIERLENTIRELKDSLQSLSEMVLQNRRGLDLLFLQQGGLCAALKEECCFYVDHTGVVTETLDKVKEGLEKRKRERAQSLGWFEGWFNSSPWMTTLISTLLGPLLIILLIVTFGPCIFNKLLNFMRRTD